ncbi:MAG TPA: PAS domain S-box protein [Usitatibacter sp.]|nr:PAS domain S-box protein [Usitatibacter sp.]
MAAARVWGRAIVISTRRLAKDESAGGAASPIAVPAYPQLFLSRLPAGPRERRIALGVIAISFLVFVALAPFAKRLLPPVPAFFPLYQAALVFCELMTAVLILGQFWVLRSRALLVLAGGYLFNVFMATAHALSFPGLFAPSGLLGANPQTTAWIYFLWHAGFPLIVMAYAVLANQGRDAMIAGRSAGVAIFGALVASLVVAGGLTLIATSHSLLPAIMQDSRDAPPKFYVATASWGLAVAAIPVLWRRRPQTVLDLWLSVVMCVWVFEVALAAVLNGGRYDVGWYAGRVYGLLAGSFVLVVLLLENGRLHADLVHSREREQASARRESERHAERLRILHEIGRSIVAEQAPETMIATILGPLRELLGVPRVLAGAFDRSAPGIRWVATSEGSVPTISGGGGAGSPVGDLEALRRGEPQLLDRNALSAGTAIDGEADRQGGALLVLPVIASGELIGALGLVGETGGFPEEQVQIAREVAAQIAIAIAQARLREGIVEQRAFLRKVIDLDRNFIFAKDREGRFTLANEALAEAYGTTVEKLIGRTDADFNSSREDVDRFRRDDLDVIDSGKEKFVLEEPITDASGRVRWMQTRKRPIVGADGRVEMMLGVASDITERKRAEMEIEARKAHAEALLEAVPDAVVIVDRGGRIVVVNAQAERTFGYSRSELLGQSVEMLVPDRLQAAHAAQREPYQQKPQGRAMEAGRDLLARRKDGSEFTVDVRLSPLATPEGGLVIAAARDVTERINAARKIRSQLEHLNLLDHITRATGERQDLKSIFQVVVGTLEESMELGFACVCVHDQAANVLEVACLASNSQELGSRLAMSEGDAIDISGNRLSRCMQGHLVYEPDIAQAASPLPERLASGGLGSLVMVPLRQESKVFGVLLAARRAVDAFSSVECEFLRQLGEHVALAANQARLFAALRQAYDDLRQTQHVVMQQERLRALGQMASGIAHDINNALSPVALYAESLLETERNLSDRARGYLVTIQRAVDDVAQTVARMREFYRQREPQIALAPVQMNDMVRQVVDLTRARWSDMAQSRGIMVEARMELAPELPKIMGVESELREALINLVLNAVDSMPEGGALTLRTRAAATGPQGRSVLVEVSDSGVGMDEETRARCLEPFFTTKGERGTGLGLAMVFGTVQRHSAELQIDSAPGAGTTMRLVFAVPQSIPLESGAAEELEAPAKLRLLVIDDDPTILKSLRDALESDGHSVVTASGGEAGLSALRVALDRGERFAAVLTDLGMPYMDGRRVAAAVKEITPRMPVILLTGWGQRLVAERDVPAHVDRVLAKPPKLRELRQALALLCNEAG